jgi:hypothetical protein
MVYVLYAPGHVPPHGIQAASHKPPGFFCELRSPGWKVVKSGATMAKGEVEEWKVHVEGIGTMDIGRDKQKWTVHIPSEETWGQGPLELVIETTQRTPWTTKSLISGPEGAKVYQRRYFFLMHLQGRSKG